MRYWLLFVALVLLITSCAPQPQPTPLPTMEAEAEYRYYWPALVKAWDTMPTHTKRGVGLIYGLRPARKLHGGFRRQRRGSMVAQLEHVAHQRPEH